MLIIGIDTEFTSLNPEESQIVEFGGVLYDTELKMVLASFGKVYKVDKWSNEAEECHGISQHASNLMPHIDDEGLIDPADVLEIDKAQYIVAHNAGCDHPIVTAKWPKFLKKPWVCTQNDVLHEQVLKKVTSRRLGHLAVDYGITIVDWHRARVDAEVCARIAGFHNLDEAYARKTEVKYKFSAKGGMFKEQREMFNTCPSTVAGVGKYKWNPDDKCWWKDRLTKEFVEADAVYIKKRTRGIKPKWSFDLEEMELPKY